MADHEIDESELVQSAVRGVAVGIPFLTTVILLGMLGAHVGFTAAMAIALIGGIIGGPFVGWAILVTGWDVARRRIS